MHFHDAVNSPSHLVLLVNTRLDLDRLCNRNQPNQKLSQLYGCEVERAYIHGRILGPRHRPALTRRPDGLLAIRTDRLIECRPLKAAARDLSLARRPRDGCCEEGGLQKGRPFVSCRANLAGVSSNE